MNLSLPVRLSDDLRSRVSGAVSYFRNPQVLYPLTIATPIALLTLYLFLTLGKYSLWLDEAWVANSILRNEPLNADSLNSTPLGFYLLVKVSSLLFGSSEFGFRLPALGFFILTLPAIAVLAREVYGRGTGGLAAVLFTTNFVVINYAQEVKPYSADMFFAVVIPLVALQLDSRPAPWRWAVYTTIVVTAPLFSFTSLVVSAAAAVFLLVQSVRSAKRRHQLTAWFVVHAVATLLVTPYVWFLFRSQRSNSLLDYWSQGFPPTSNPASMGLWAGQEVWRLLVWFFWGDAEGIFLLLVYAFLCVGLLALIIRKPTAVILFLGPGALLLMSALLHVYPFQGWLGGRLLVCILSSCLVVVAGGLVSAPVRQRLPVRVWMAYRVGATVVVILFAARGLFQLWSNEELPGLVREEVRPLINSVLTPQIQHGDSIYVYYPGVHAFEFYAPTYRAAVRPAWGNYTVANREGVQIVYGGEHLDDRSEYGREVERLVDLPSTGRLWILVTHVIGDEDVALTRPIFERGLVARVWQERGAALYLVNHSSGI